MWQAWGKQVVVFFRKIFRLTLLLPWLIYLGVISVPVTLRRDKWRAIAGMAKMTKYWGRGLLRIFNIRLRVHGNMDEYDGGLVVSNHMGYVDVFVHAAVFGLRFAPKKEIRSWPVLGWYTSFTHPVWVDRSSRIKSQKTLTEFRETLEHKVPLIIYPEGTSTDGKQILPFKSAPFELAADGGFSIQPILTVYRVPEGSDTPCWFGDMELMPHLWSLVGIPYIDADVYILPQVSANGRTRKELARAIHEIIREAHEKFVIKQGDAC